MFLILCAPFSLCEKKIVCLPAPTISVHVCSLCSSSYLTALPKSSHPCSFPGLPYHNLPRSWIDLSNKSSIIVPRSPLVPRAELWKLQHMHLKGLYSLLVVAVKPSTVIWKPLHSCKKQIYFQLSFWSGGEREWRERSITCFHVCVSTEKLHGKRMHWEVCGAHLLLEASWWCLQMRFVVLVNEALTLQRSRWASVWSLSSTLHLDWMRHFTHKCKLKIAHTPPGNIHLVLCTEDQQICHLNDMLF